MNFEFTSEYVEHPITNRKAYRIRAKIDFITKECFKVKKGTLGGFVDKEKVNLSNFDGGWFWGGTFWGGTFWGGTFWDGTFEGGTFRDGTFEGGTFEGGTFEGGLIKNNDDFFVALSVGSSFGKLTVVKEKNGSLLITIGCFNGTLEEFETAVKKTHGNNKSGKEYQALIKYIKIRFGVKK